MILGFRFFYMIGFISSIFFSHHSLAEVTKINLVGSGISLSYTEQVRFSQVLTDAYAYAPHNIYPLGIALIDLEKQSIVEEKKKIILRQLEEIDTIASIKIAEKINTLSFVYRENIETNINKVRLITKKNPMIRGEYWLSLPKRPKNIFIISSFSHLVIKPSTTPNYKLSDYLNEVLGSHVYDFSSAWVIQANQDVYEVKDIHWKKAFYYLSPGSIVFLGIKNLPDAYSNLNADIAHLLTFNQGT